MTAFRSYETGVRRERRRRVCIRNAKCKSEPRGMLVRKQGEAFEQANFGFLVGFAHETVRRRRGGLLREDNSDILEEKEKLNPVQCNGHGETNFFGCGGM